MPTNHPTFYCVYHQEFLWLGHFSKEKSRRQPKKCPADKIKQLKAYLNKKRISIRQNEKNFYLCSKELANFLNHHKKIHKTRKTFSNKKEESQANDISKFVKQIREFAGDEAGVELFCDKLVKTTFGQKYLAKYTEFKKFGLSNKEIEHFLDNTKTLFDGFGIKSHNRQPILSFLTKDIRSKTMAEFFDVSLSLINKSKQLTPNQVEESQLFKQRFCKEYSEQLSENELSDFRLFLELYCNPPSGTNQDMFFSQITPQGLFEKYAEWRNELNETRMSQKSEEEADIIIAAMENKERVVPGLHNMFPVRSRQTFDKMRKHFHIRFYKKNWLWCGCNICTTKCNEVQNRLTQLRNLQNLSRAELSEKKKLEEKERKYELHKKLITHHRKIKKQILSELDDTSLVVNFDFVAFNFPIDKCKFYTINDFVLVLEFKRSGELKREYYDFFCDKSVLTNNTQFVQTALNWLKDNGFFRRYLSFYFFSDNAQKHFKNRMTVQYFSKIATECGRSLHWIFWASHHGFSMCDAHGGKMSSILDKTQKDEMTIYNTPQQFQQALNSLSNTKMIELTTINSTVGPDAPKLKGISTFHHLSFGPNTVVMKESYQNSLQNFNRVKQFNYDNLNNLA